VGGKGRKGMVRHRREGLGERADPKKEGGQAKKKKTRASASGRGTQKKKGGCVPSSENDSFGRENVKKRRHLGQDRTSEGKKRHAYEVKGDRLKGDAAGRGGEPGEREWGRPIQCPASEQ